ncbi:type 1 glutamine amidotransferase [Myceligenerans xiligouense]|uniref:GMP synthase-like glutamine amidotransferase n=1 Tax=Myceligenerans xiligouense TaxID=253184 RepID=A0A3N4ZJ81_9MICO|nr:type 1 glutamine amidotransferase [Myceligenerans xiligouense]RPF19971.1 GMP synthase-like glutamine amidotransferase [Myceligenerans xiligouense]
MTRVLVVRNSEGSGPRRLGGWLADAGVTADVVPAWEGLPDRLDGYDGVVLLGGGYLPDDDAEHPWLPRERALTAEALDRGTPLLGICLGEQLLAHVAGGEVTARSGETERGMCALEVLPEAAGDPLLGQFMTGGGQAGAAPGNGPGVPVPGRMPAGHVLADRTADPRNDPVADRVADRDAAPTAVVPEPLWMLENHEDSVTALPPGATLLVTSPECRVQAFRVGRAAWGLQFHPEAPPDAILRWDEAALAGQGLDRAALASAAQERADQNTTQSRALIHSWTKMLRSVQ